MVCGNYGSVFCNQYPNHPTASSLLYNITGVWSRVFQQARVLNCRRPSCSPLSLLYYTHFSSLCVFSPYDLCPFSTMPMCRLSASSLLIPFSPFSTTPACCLAALPLSSISFNVQQSSTKAKSSSKAGKGGSTKKPASAAAATAPASPAPGAQAPTAPGPGSPATAAATLPSLETTQADIQRLKDDEVERRRTDPVTDLHLWTFWRKNPLGDGGVLPIDDPKWPGPLREVCRACCARSSVGLCVVGGCQG